MPHVPSVRCWSRKRYLPSSPRARSSSHTSRESSSAGADLAAAASSGRAAPRGKCRTSSPRWTDRCVNVTGVGGTGPGRSSPGSQYARVTCGDQVACSLADRSSRASRSTSAPGSMTPAQAGTFPSLLPDGSKEPMPVMTPARGPGSRAAAAEARRHAYANASSSTSLPRYATVTWCMSRPPGTGVIVPSGRSSEIMPERAVRPGVAPFPKAFGARPRSVPPATGPPGA